jgi:hypothetical protein
MATPSRCLSASTADDAVRVSGGEATVYGYLAAPAGGVEVGGELLTLSCGVVADRVDLAGSGLVIDADVCNAVAPTNLPPVLMPGLTVALETAPASVHPTETVTASAVVSFDQGWLVIPAIVGVQNLGDAAITVEDLTVSLSAPTGTAGAWESLVLAVDWEATPLPTAAGPGDDLGREVAASDQGVLGDRGRGGGDGDRPRGADGGGRLG